MLSLLRSVWNMWKMLKNWSFNNFFVFFSPPFLFACLVFFNIFYLASIIQGVHKGGNSEKSSEQYLHFCCFLHQQAPTPTPCFESCLSGLIWHLVKGTYVELRCDIAFPRCTGSHVSQWGSGRTEKTEQEKERTPPRHTLLRWKAVRRQWHVLFWQIMRSHGVGCYISSLAAVHSLLGLLCREANGM